MFEPFLIVVFESLNRPITHIFTDSARGSHTFKQHCICIYIYICVCVCVCVCVCGGGVLSNKLHRDKQGVRYSKCLFYLFIHFFHLFFINKSLHTVVLI